MIQVTQLNMMQEIKTNSVKISGQLWHQYKSRARYMEQIRSVADLGADQREMVTNEYCDKLIKVNNPDSEETTLRPVKEKKETNLFPTMNVSP